MSAISRHRRRLSTRPGWRWHRTHTYSITTWGACFFLSRSQLRKCISGNLFPDQCSWKQVDWHLVATKYMPQYSFGRVSFKCCEIVRVMSHTESTQCEPSLNSKWSRAPSWNASPWHILSSSRPPIRQIMFSIEANKIYTRRHLTGAYVAGTKRHLYAMQNRNVAIHSINGKMGVADLVRILGSMAPNMGVIWDLNGHVWHPWLKPRQARISIYSDSML